MSEVTKIQNHEGSKYLRKIYPADGIDFPPHINVDVYAVLAAFNVTCPARQHAIKKLLCAGIRGKGNEKEDLVGAIAAINRAIELQEQLERRLPLKEVVTKETIGKDTALKYDESQGGLSVSIPYKQDPKWEVMPSYDLPSEEDEAKGQHQAKLIGFRVRWSEGDSEGRYLWVRHYLTDENPGSPSLNWCKHAAERDAQRLNEEKKLPSEFPAYHA